MARTIGAIGDLTVDIIIPGLTRIPEWGQEVEIGKPILRLGGNIGNMAVGASALKSDFRIFSIVGKDDDGSFILNRIQELNLDADDIEITDQESTCKTYACLRNDGERFMLTYKGTLECIESTMIKSNISTDIVFLGGWCLPPRVEEERLIQCIEYWKADQKIVSTDLIWSDDTWNHKNLLTNFLNKIDILFMNESELFALTGEESFDKAVNKVKTMMGMHGQPDGRLCVIKLGAKGAALIEGDMIFRAGAYPVKPVDIVGAGDLFNIGFLHAMFQIGMDSQNALEFASTFASVFISKYYDSPPTQNDIMELMKQLA